MWVTQQLLIWLPSMAWLWHYSMIVLPLALLTQRQLTQEYATAGRLFCCWRFQLYPNQCKIPLPDWFCPLLTVALEVLCWFVGAGLGNPPENLCIRSDVKYSPTTAVPSVVECVEVSSTYLWMGTSQNLDISKQCVKLEFSPKYIEGVISKVRMQPQQYGW